VAEAGSLADRTDPSVCGAAVESLPVPASKDRAFVAFADSEVDGPGRSWD
jgi:hypothetical protein